MTSTPQSASAPLLGVAGHWGSTEIEVARRFDDLHQLLYMRGGVRPTNAAVEEVAKLIFLRLWGLKSPNSYVGASVSAADLFTNPDQRDDLVGLFKQAFTTALSSTDLVAASPSGRLEPIWPLDEPFRLQDPAALAAAVNLIDEIVTTGTPSVSDPLGTAFDALLSGKYDHSGGLGTYLTPSSVARLMAEVAIELLDVTEAEKQAPGFGDPYCGTGRFLVAAIEALRDSDRSVAKSLLSAGAFGADQSPSAVAKARINMLLYGDNRPLVWTVKDSVTDSDLAALHGQIPLILTNPPFGEGKYDDPIGIAATGAAIPKLAGKARIDPAMAGLVKSIRLLQPGGVVGIVLPDGLTESRAFEDLLANDFGDLGGKIAIAANVSLPTATFSLSGTVAKTSAIFLRRESRPSRVAIARADHVGYIRQAGKAAADPEGNDLPTISKLIREGFSKTDAETLVVMREQPLVALAEADAIQSYDPSRLDPVAMDARRSLLQQGGVEMRAFLAAKRVRRGKAKETNEVFVSVLHVDDLGNIAWHEANTHRPTTPGFVATGGDLIVSLLNPSKLRAGVIPPDVGEVQVSAEFGIFRASCNPYAALGLLYSERVKNQLKPLGRGTSSSRRRIDAEDVLSLIVPNLQEDDLLKLGRRVEAAIEMVATGRQTLYGEFSSI
ncbi:class I SAM-dependent DNA methyltransferase [Micromonospora sp. C28ISP2-4]|uniref:HsdM family class I SAM-dependent methyltransferase n=1 Tax=Micromonospora sp. C28ISP2-4 TaxID=3059523 RepID=UPI002675F0EB|nr:N-6 DNA methylase [Micromonospora sp. C28ISP2-4]MDO3683473.1 N-6 DNA methylase [Micromonospora sp. C28ISP2-4]